MPASWSPRQRKYQEWLALLPAHRDPSVTTINQLADALGTNLDTLRRWENLDGWWEEVYKYAKVILGEALPEVLDAVVIKAKSGSIAAAKLVLQSLNVYVEKTEHHLDLDEDQLIVVVSSKGQKQEAAADGKPSTTNAKEENQEG